MKTIDEIKLIKDKVRVDLVYIGEGNSGDFNEDDETDEPLLRFDVYAHKSVVNPYADGFSNKGWVAMSDSSYCTQLSARDTKENRKRAKEALEQIMDEVKHKVLSGDNIKKTCESLSWVS